MRINPKRPPKERIPAILDDLVEATLKKTTLKKTILKRTILEKKPISVPGEIKRIPFNIKRENVNNFVKQSDEILYFTKFHQLLYSF